MTYERKRQVVCAALLVLTIWPLVHHVTVRSLDLDPWKLFGWSMYTVPPRRVRAFPVSLDDGRRLGVDGLSPHHAALVMSAYDDFAQLRMQFGALVTPDEFARALFVAYPDVEGIAIDVRHIRVDRSTAKVSERSHPPYKYHRRDMAE
ncbi:MAG: hypothetical protein V3T07_07970 [Myxococcota bacterium]